MVIYLLFNYTFNQQIIKPCLLSTGIILVHDLSNRKSQQNLQKWLEEVISKDGTIGKSKSFDDFDPEKFMGSTQVIFTIFLLYPAVK